jgi:hypothetical protein
MNNDNLPFLDKYSGESVDELIAMSATHRVDSIVLAFDEALNQKPTLTDTEKVIVVIESFERQVNNGGFNAFCFNTPYHVKGASDSLKKIGCPKSAALLENALLILGVKSRTTELEIQTLAADATTEQDEQLDKLDADFYRLSTESIENNLFEFIKLNRDEISFPGRKTNILSHLLGKLSRQ